jgi:hypothetical protein
MKNIIYPTLGICLGFPAPSRADSFNLGTDQGVTEDDGSVTITVTRTGSAPLGAESIEVSTIDGSATGGDDFSPLGGILVNFPANANPAATTDTRTINIPLINDLDSECEEEFVVRITQATGNSIGGGDLKITIAESDFVILPWDSGITDSPAPGAPSLIELTDQPGVYCYKIVTTNEPLWRTRLTVTSGEAELDLHRDPFSAQDSADYVSGTPGSDGILLHDSQFSPSQDWYLRVRVTEPNTTWSLFSGSVFVHDQGVLTSDANYSGPAYDDLPFPPEKALFFTATPPAGAKARALWNDEYRAGSSEAFISVRKTSQECHWSLASSIFDKPGKCS